MAEIVTLTATLTANPGRTERLGEMLFRSVGPPQIVRIDSALVSALDSELERRPDGELRLQANLKDPAAQELMTLLIADANEGYTTERPYKEDLTQDLAVRMLFFGRRIQPQASDRGTSGLPRPVLRRIIERMRCFSCDLSVQALANESGYSRVHFGRMFKAATGYSPHTYLLNLKLERARELLKNPSLSLIDIALDCGFSSHSHMSRLFHKRVGVTPNAYRRGLRPELITRQDHSHRAMLFEGIYSPL